MNKLNIILSGIVRNNPTFVLVLGMCPTLGTTTSAENGMGMGLATMAVLIMSNLVISLIKNIIPDKVRIPAFIVVIASFVTVVEMLMKAYTPPLYEALGVFIPLIVVNCIILGRAYRADHGRHPRHGLHGILGAGITTSRNAKQPPSEMRVAVFVERRGIVVTGISEPGRRRSRLPGRCRRRSRSGCRFQACG